MMQVYNYIDNVRAISKDTKYLRWYVSLITMAINRVSTTGYIEYHHILPKSLGGDNDMENIVSLSAREHFVCHNLLSKMMLEKQNKKKMLYAFLMMAKCKNQNQQRVINSRAYDRIKALLSEMCAGENNHFYGRTHSEESRRKIGEKSKGRIPNAGTREKMSIARIGKKKDQEIVKKQVKARIANGNHRHSTETKKKISEARLGYKTGLPAWNSGKTKDTDENVNKISESCKGRIPWNKDILEDDPRRQIGVRNGFFQKNHSEETRLHLSNVAHNRPRYTCIYCGKSVTKCNLTRWHNDKCKENGSM